MQKAGNTQNELHYHEVHSHILFEFIHRISDSLLGYYQSLPTVCYKGNICALKTKQKNVYKQNMTCS